jgi:Rhodopirellula transposase DDE domain
VQCELDKKSYAKGIKVTDADMATLNIESDLWHPEWNYTIRPRRPAGAVILEPRLTSPRNGLLCAFLCERCGAGASNSRCAAAGDQRHFTI